MKKRKYTLYRNPKGEWDTRSVHYAHKNAQGEVCKVFIDVMATSIQQAYYLAYANEYQTREDGIGVIRKVNAIQETVVQPDTLLPKEEYDSRQRDPYWKWNVSMMFTTPKTIKEAHKIRLDGTGQYEKKIDIKTYTKWVLRLVESGDIVIVCGEGEKTVYRKTINV